MQQPCHPGRVEAGSAPSAPLLPAQLLSCCPQAVLPAAAPHHTPLPQRVLASVTLAQNSWVMKHVELVPKHFRTNTAWRTAYGSCSRFLSTDMMWRSLSSPVQ